MDESRIKCYACGELGHRRAKCPKNPRSFVHRVSRAFDQREALGPMVTGTVNGERVSSILRDTGCSCVIVADETLPDAAVKTAPLVNVTDYLGRTDEFPIVKCYIDC